MEPSIKTILYQYKPLDSNTQEIRLVHLLPASNISDPIKLRLVHVPFPQPSPSLATRGQRHPRRNPAELEALEKEFSLPWGLEETKEGELIAFNVATGQTYLLDGPQDDPEPSPDSSGLDQPPDYEALSYTWGEAGISEFATIVEPAEEDEPTSPISQSCSYVLGIRQNLSSALRHLRQQHRPRILWIDAVCINQDDLHERNTQVKRMMDIYTLASRVVAWLGDEEQDSRRAITTLQYVGRQLRSTKSGRVIAAPDATEPRLWRNDTPPSFFTEQDWRAVMALVERPWFYRIWCWQEIKLGSASSRAGKGAILQCGPEATSWRDFWLAILCLHNKDTTSGISRHFRERCRHIVFLQYEGESVANLLDTARSKGCADPRDKIYGLLGITPSYFRTAVKVDYDRLAGEIYKEAFLAHLGATKRLDLLKHCNSLSSSGETSGQPSWVPDWSRTEFAAPVLSEQISSGISRAWYAYDETRESLEVVGKEYTVVRSVSRGVASKTEEETLLIVKEWYEEFVLPLGETSPYLSNSDGDEEEDRQTAFILALCMDRTMERHPDNHFLSAWHWVSMLHGILRITEAADPLYQQREIANLIQKVRGRRFIVTESGHFGTAPEGTRVGDVVSLLLGTYAPIILRPQGAAPDTKGSFQVVGEGYLHGLSDAVGLLGPVPHPWQPVIIGDALGRMRLWFMDVVTGERTLEDPRLSEGPLPYQGWDRAVYERTVEDPAIFERFVNLGTGDVINHDPRMSVEALEARGVELRRFLLI